MNWHTAYAQSLAAMQLVTLETTILQLAERIVDAGTSHRSAITTRIKFNLAVNERRKRRLTQSKVGRKPADRVAA